MSRARCKCGRFARFLRWTIRGGPWGEAVPVITVECSRCGTISFEDN